MVTSSRARSADSRKGWSCARWRSAAGLSPVARAADETVTLNFVNADIEAVVKAVAEITGRNFIIDPRVKGTVNIISAKPVPKSLVYPTLLSALRLQGFAAVEGHGCRQDRSRSRRQAAGRRGDASGRWRPAGTDWSPRSSSSGSNRRSSSSTCCAP